MLSVGALGTFGKSSVKRLLRKRERFHPRMALVQANVPVTSLVVASLLLFSASRSHAIEMEVVAPECREDVCWLFYGEYKACLRRRSTWVTDESTGVYKWNSPCFFYPRWTAKPRIESFDEVPERTSESCSSFHERLRAQLACRFETIIGADPFAPVTLALEQASETADTSWRRSRGPFEQSCVSCVQDGPKLSCTCEYGEDRLLRYTTLDTLFCIDGSVRNVNGVLKCDKEITAEEETKIREGLANCQTVGGSATVFPLALTILLVALARFKNRSR